MTGVRPSRRTTSSFNPSILRCRAQVVMRVTARSRCPCSAHFSSYMGDLAGIRMYSVRAGMMSVSQVRWTKSRVRPVSMVMAPTILLRHGDHRPVGTDGGTAGTGRPGGATADTRPHHRGDGDGQGRGGRRHPQGRSAGGAPAAHV